MLESDLQKAIITWSRTKLKVHPELKWLHSVPNGGKRDSRTAQLMVAEGVKAGVLDLHLPVPRGGFHGLMLELKRPGGKCLAPSKEQSEYLEFLTEQGYCTIVSNDFNELKNHITNYLQGELVK